MNVFITHPDPDQSIVQTVLQGEAKVKWQVLTTSEDRVKLKQHGSSADSFSFAKDSSKPLRYTEKMFKSQEQR